MNMVILCKGICDTLPSFSRYVDGFQYCCICSMFLPCEKNRCPCCHACVRMYSRMNRAHRKKVYI